MKFSQLNMVKAMLKVKHLKNYFAFHLTKNNALTLQSLPEAKQESVNQTNFQASLDCLQFLKTLENTKILTNLSTDFHS